jgi:signal transduction histidine kinase
MLPIAASGETGRAGVLIVGLSPFRLFDGGYRGFLNLVAGQIAAAIANAQAYEEERRRAEALAEIDRAKTAFFSNVSHEFRTPLTLMVGPLEDALAHADELPSCRRDELQMAHRNALRLLRLVNALLDFSRTEAGRMQARFEPTDLPTLTRDLASNFQSVCERAGVGLLIDCEPLSRPIHVDREMWEKIVLNLVSNAFKFTFSGRIEVRLRDADGQAELTVSDSGVGIPAQDLPKVFERFHRVEGQRSRTHEGTGIGLALVRELVNLHGGEICVESEVGRGTTVQVRIPCGVARPSVAPRPQPAPTRSSRRPCAGSRATPRLRPTSRASRRARRRPTAKPNWPCRVRESWLRTTMRTCATTYGGCSTTTMPSRRSAMAPRRSRPRGEKSPISCCRTS